MENNPMASPYLSPPISNFPFSTNLLFSHDNNTNNSPIIPSFHQHDHHLLGLKRENNNEAGSSSGVIKEEEKKEGKEKKVRRHRYAFHTRSQVDILDDGYRWRKYGQKAVKNNKFPRSYYRCTHPGCNVKKQVQRLTKDEEVVVTTYEGVHTHPVERSTDNFEHILKQMQIYVPP